MPFNLTSLTRKNVLRLNPYSTARDDFEGNASIFLDANENPYDTSYNRYPDPKQKALRQKIASLKGAKAEETILGNGSDELIDLLFRVFCEPGVDNVIIPQPTYGMYSVCAHLNDIKTREPQLTSNFHLDVNDILSQADDKTKLIFLCSPNNPTGNLLDRESIHQLLNRFHGLVIVDEAYIDFTDTRGMLETLNQYPNLVVLQTLSKAWGLAGLRIGIGFASKELIQILMMIKPPYNINSSSQTLALQRLEDNAFYAQCVENTLTEKNHLIRQLNTFSFIQEVFPSDSNFILVRMNDAQSVYHFLLDKGIVVRDRSSAPGCYNCLRITVGTPEENRMVINELSNFQKSITQ